MNQDWRKWLVAPVDERSAEAVASAKASADQASKAKSDELRRHGNVDSDLSRKFKNDEDRKRAHREIDADQQAKVDRFKAAETQHWQDARYGREDTSKAYESYAQMKEAENRAFPGTVPPEHLAAAKQAAMAAPGSQEQKAAVAIVKDFQAKEADATKAFEQFKADTLKESNAMARDEGLKASIADGHRASVKASYEANGMAHAKPERKAEAQQLVDAKKNLRDSQQNLDDVNKKYGIKNQQDIEKLPQRQQLEVLDAHKQRNEAAKQFQQATQAYTKSNQIQQNQATEKAASPVQQQQKPVQEGQKQATTWKDEFRREGNKFVAKTDERQSFEVRKTEEGKTKVRVTGGREEPSVALQAALDRSKESGVKSVRVSEKASPEFKSNLYVEAKMRGMEVKGYQPTKQDQEKLDKRMSAKSEKAATVTERPAREASRQETSTASRSEAESKMSRFSGRLAQMKEREQQLEKAPQQQQQKSKNDELTR